MVCNRKPCAEPNSPPFDHAFKVLTKCNAKDYIFVTAPYIEGTQKITTTNTTGKSSGGSFIHPVPATSFSYSFHSKPRFSIDTQTMIRL